MNQFAKRIIKNHLNNGGYRLTKAPNGFTLMFHVDSGSVSETFFETAPRTYGALLNSKFKLKIIKLHESFIFLINR